MSTLLTLTVEEGSDKGRAFTLSEPIVTIGRAVTSQVMLNDSLVSKKHGEIRFKDNKYIFRDLESKNGSIVKRVDEEINVGSLDVPEQQLQQGDKLILGQTVLVIDYQIDVVPEDNISDTQTNIVLTKPQPKFEEIDSEVEKDHRTVVSLYKLTQRIGSVFDQEELLDNITDVILEVFERASHVVIIMKDEIANKFVPVTAKVKRDMKVVKVEHVDISSSIVKRIFTEGETILFEDAQSVFGRKGSVMLSKIRSCLCAPLWTKDKIIGILQVDNRDKTGYFTKHDVDLITLFAYHIARAIENAQLAKESIAKEQMEQELKIAHDIQVGMLPLGCPEIKGFEIAATSLPAKEVGGDFYDFVEKDADHLGLIIGDVSGKGVSGAMVMAAARSAIKLAAMDEPSAALVLKKTNEYLCRDIKKKRFVALFYGVIEGKERILRFANAGQTVPIIYRAKEKRSRFIAPVEDGAFPLGIDPKCSYREDEILLSKGDSIVFYTDGIVEETNSAGEMYGFERFQESIDKAEKLSAEAILSKLMEDVTNFAGKDNHDDDLTVAILKVL